MDVQQLVTQLACTELVRGKEWQGAAVESIIASDLMSDVLVIDKEGVVLVTSLATQQTIRSADIINALAVIVVNNKGCDKAMVRLAQELNMCLCSVKEDKFSTCIKIGKILGL
jgi:flagellar biosynthesis regulator FlbT